jgi:cell division protein FtsI/penicillin-binding protein 2/cell division protein FtsW (lipid II flippase)
MTYAAKTMELPETTAKLARGDLLDLNRAPSAEALLPFLNTFPGRDGRELAAARTFAFLDKARPVRNVGALSALRISVAEIESDPRWDTLRRSLPAAGTHPTRVALFPVARLKRLFVVRSPAEFRAAFLTWTALYFAGFWMVAFVWRQARFQGDRTFLTALHLLTGIGLILMLSLRDPLRDSLEFRKFAIGVLLGCLLLLAPLFKAFHHRRLAEWCYTPLALAFALFVLLLRFGSGPGGSRDIKVNLGPFQPVELIKICLVLFMAGYFSVHWERLRDLREKRLLPGFLRRAGIPRFQDWLPACVAVAISLVLFFALKDLGPALVVFFVFLTMFMAARGRPWLAVLALALVVTGVTLGYRLGTPHTVVERIDMWLSPWDNNVRGGNQLAHSLWALSTGGAWGSGPGWGDPALIPAGSTDLVLPAIGEEWGFCGVAAVLVIFGFLVWRALRAADRASSHFGFFLSLGLASLLASEMVLITCGVLGVLPLSGVVSPFLSSGNTAMLANFLVVAILVSVSASPRESEDRELLSRPTRSYRWALAAAGLLLLAMASRYQVFQDRSFLARDARTFEEDGVKRAQHNPRLNSLAREIPRGSILDRTGLPLATSDWKELERHRAEYEALGISLEEACSRMEGRHYPFGAATAQITGDLRTGENFHASNSSLVEHDSNRRLLGYDFSELVPLVRSRHEPGNEALARILARDRNVRLTLDLRLQLRAYEILGRHLQKSGNSRGAAVVMNASTGDVLALVNAPAPDPPGKRAVPPTPDELLDRARYGQYPPGSTFKLVTAIAALRSDGNLTGRAYTCRPFPGGRPGTSIEGWRRRIYDDIGDHAHGTLSMERAIEVSCNAYFAQLGVHDVGSEAIRKTAALVGLSAGDPSELRKELPFAAYGQGPVLTTPFKTARVSAAIANGGRMPQGRWILDDSNTRTDSAIEVLPASSAAFLAHAMRLVVTGGTARHAMSGASVSIAGKTGTAQLDRGLPHAWFTGFAPYDAEASQRIAFAVLVEHGGYGGRVSAPIARDIVEAARELGVIPGQAKP